MIQRYPRAKTTNAIVDIVEVDRARPHSRASTNDNRRLWSRRPDLGQQLLDEQEVGQIVDGKLQLDAIDRLLVRRHHDARHGNQVVNLWHVVELLCRPTNIGQGGEVELQKAHGDVRVLGLDLGHDGLDAGLGAGGEDEEGGLGGAELEGELACYGVVCDARDEDLRGVSTCV